MVFTPNDIFKEYTESDFNAQCLNVFRFQAKNNLIYAQYLSHLKIKPLQIEHYTQIPFLPISLFKTQRIYIGNTNPTIIFTSSSTTGQTPSKHLVADISFYENSFIQSFIQQYGNITDYCVLGLLPSYLERNGSSLVYMTDYLIKQSNDLQSGFYLYDYKKLEEILIKKDAEKKVLLIGVTFALLDFIENRKLNLKQTIVMETGGMKGRKEELTRPEVHEKLKQGFGLTSIHSEYGMTELLSQAYAKQNGIFHCPPWMRVLIRQTTDPFTYCKQGKQGAINIIDLANVYSCSFIATDDMGKQTEDGFEVLGRLDASEIRGCNLMIS